MGREHVLPVSRGQRPRSVTIASVLAPILELLSHVVSKEW